jgi:hypothetical protein
MKQRLAQTAMNGKTTRTALAFFAAGMIFSGCEGPHGGQSDNEGRSLTVSAPAAKPAAVPSTAAASEQKSADAIATVSAGNKGTEAGLPQTVSGRLASAANDKVWEIRERINATPEQDLYVTVTLQIGAGGRPVSVMGATARAGRGGTSRDVMDILALDPTGLVMAPAAAKRTTTESVIIKGE